MEPHEVEAHLEPQYWRIEVFDSKSKEWNIWKDRLLKPDPMLHALRRNGHVARVTLSAIKPGQK